MAVVLTLTEALPPECEGQTYQLHALPGNKVRLALVELPPPDTRCPIVVAGERCGKNAGHEGKHMWANGD